MNEPKILKIGTQEIKYYEKPEYVPKATIFEHERLLNGPWRKAMLKYPCENPKHLWGGFKKFGVLPIIRVEVSPIEGTQEGGIKYRIYSIGKRPTLGILPLITKYHPEHRKQILQATAYNLDGFIYLGGPVQDDKYFAEKILRVPYFTDIPYVDPPKEYLLRLSDEQVEEYRQKCLEGHYYWVRTDPYKEYPPEVLEQLESISLVPVSQDGCNSEFMALDMARRLSTLLLDGYEWKHLDTSLILQRFFDESLPWHESFAIKPVQGLYGDDVVVYYATNDTEKKSRAKEEIKKLVCRLGPRKLMIQPYIPDRVVERDGALFHEIWKLYFAHIDGRYTFTGGMVQGSQSEIVCGIENTYLSPLLTR